jgi:hypothetical protein
MALHTGAAEERNGDYFGPPVNRVARLLSAAHGGQVLLSLPAQELVRDQLPVGTSIRDLGEHRLKDLFRPERVFQLLAPELPSEFPSLRTLDAFRNNLPLQPTPLPLAVWRPGTPPRGSASLAPAPAGSEGSSVGARRN